MKIKLTNQSLAVFSLMTGLIFVLLTEPLFSNFHKGVFNDYERVFIEPLFFWTISLFTCSLILMFFSQTIFKKWLRSILVWFFPVGLLITFLSDVSISYVLPNRVGVAILFGEVLVVTTLIFALIQKFRYKL